MVDAASNILDEKCILCHSCRENVFCQYRMTVRNLRVVYVRLTNGVVVIKKDANNCYNDIVSEINEMRKMTPLTKYVDKDDSLINKEDCQDLLNSAITTAEMQRIRHAIASTLNLSQRQAQRLGIRHLKERAIQVENATETLKNIRSKHRYFGKIEQKTFLESQSIDSQ